MSFKAFKENYRMLSRVSEGCTELLGDSHTFRCASGGFRVIQERFNRFQICLKAFQTKYTGIFDDLRSRKFLKIVKESD